jgi:solute:Na+ symporter, SSS family
VRGAADYALAQGRFGIPIATATVFATWFGAETVLGIPAAFLQQGLAGVAADPFAAAGCLVLVGALFARPLFRLDAITLGDYFRARYGRAADVILSLAIAMSYLGWVAAQLVALGLTLDLLTGGAVDMRTGIVLGALAVLAYTMAGGMWSVSLTDLLQAAVIVAGLGYVAWEVARLAGGAARVVEAASAAGRLRLLPAADARSVLDYAAASLVVLLGSVPQQDVFQRIRSARDEATAARAAILGGVLYFAVAFVPIFLVSAAQLIDAPMVARLMGGDYQRILPTLILERTPLVVQALFFGALLSAILSTAASALLAPAVVLAENVIRPLLALRGGVAGRAPPGDRALLTTMRLTVAGLAAVVTAMALGSTLSIYDLVNNSGKVVLVAAFVPLAAGLFWRGANARGALLAIALGLATWIALEALAPDATVPPVLAGLAASVAGMLAGSAAGAARRRSGSA